MSNSLKDISINFVKSIAGGFVATVTCCFCKALVHHELGFAESLWNSILIYTALYGVLFMMLHLDSKPTRLTICVTAFIMVAVTCLITYADDIASFTVWVAVGQVGFALVLTSATRAFFWKALPYGLGKS